MIGGGFAELLGELTAFADDVLRFYPGIRRDEVRFLLFEARARALREIDETVAVVAARVRPAVRRRHPCVDASPIDRGFARRFRS